MRKTLLACALCALTLVAEARTDWGAPPPPPPGPPPVAIQVVASAPCTCCPRPGLLVRLRDRLFGRPRCTCCSPCPPVCAPVPCCPPRPTLWQRLRDRIAGRPACCP